MREQDGGAVLVARGLRKAYGSTMALDGVDLDVAAGEIVGLLGPNGAGKTTLVSIVAGLRRADAGRVTIGAIDVGSHPHRARRLLGLAPQETGIYPTLTCRQNLRFFAELAGLAGRELRRAVDEVAGALELHELLDRRGQQLSGGERRRLHTAIALVHRPPLVVLDEPTTGADVRTRARLLGLVTELAASGSAVVYSTHYLAEIEQLGGSVAILDHGRVVARGNVASLVADHATSVVELTFDGAAPSLRTDEWGTRVDVDGAVLRIRTREPGVVTARILDELGPPRPPAARRRHRAPEPRGGVPRADRPTVPASGRRGSPCRVSGAPPSSVSSSGSWRRTRSRCSCWWASRCS